MKVSEIQSLARTLHGDTLGDAALLDSLGHELLSEWEDESVHLSFMSDLFAAVNEYKDGVFNQAAAAELYMQLQPHLVEGRSYFGFTPDTKRLMQLECYLNEGHEGIHVYLTDAQHTSALPENLLLFVSKEGEFEVHPELIRDRLGSVSGATNRVLTNVGQALGTKYSLAQLAIQGAKARWTADLGSTVTQLTTLISESRQYLSDYWASLTSAIATGPKAIYTAIASIFNAVKTTADYDGASILSSTSITVRTVYAGFLLSTLQTVWTVASAVITSISRIIGLITLAAGVITTTAMKVVGALTTGFKDTRFELHNDPTAVHCFSFVVEQGVIDPIPALNDMLDANGEVYLTLFDPVCGGVAIFALTDPFNPRTSPLQYELHLSCDLSLSQVLYSGSVLVGDSSIAVHGFDPFGAGFAKVGFMLGPDMQAWIKPGAQWPSGCDFSRAVILTTPSDISLPYKSSAARKQMIESDVYQPLDYNLFESFQNVTGLDNKLQAVLTERLASSIILYVLARQCCDCDDEVIASNQGHMLCVGLSNIQVETTQSPIRTWNGLLNSAIKILGSAKPTAGLFYLWDFSDPRVDAVDAVDPLVLSIQSMFDGLAYQDSIIAQSGCYSRILLWNDLSQVSYSAGFVVPAMNAIRSPQARSLTYHMAKDLFLSPVAMYSNYPIAAVLSFLRERPDCRFFGAGRYAIGLPTLTFKAYVQGIILDATVTLAAIAVSVGAFFVSKRIKNIQAQTQAKTESAWYDYQDAQSNLIEYNETHQLPPPTKAELQKAEADAWARYKSTRAKSNVISMALGKSTMSLSMYDDDTAGGSAAIDRLTGLIMPESVDANGVTTDAPGYTAFDALYYCITGKKPLVLPSDDLQE